MKWHIMFEQVLARILEGIITLCFFCILILIITLVVLRYGFNTTIVGANELVVILFIYSSALGAAVVISKNEHISITYFIDKLPPFLRRYVDILRLLLVGFLNGAMIWFSIRWISITGGYLTAVLRIPQFYAQMIVPIGCGVAVLFCLNQIILTLFPQKA